MRNYLFLSKFKLVLKIINNFLNAIDNKIKTMLFTIKNRFVCERMGIKAIHGIFFSSNNFTNCAIYLSTISLANSLIREPSTELLRSSRK